ncbi:S49 family peptidase [Methylocaldum sp.]|uniref:S49 family peptidase n=1 Tax=Methylocaldum sp. TaxID=1969727 RepID=UPI00321FBA9A
MTDPTNFTPKNQNTSDDGWAREALLRIVEENLKEWRRSRRWRFAFKALSYSFVALMLVMTAFSGWQTFKAQHSPHAAVIKIMGEISAESGANADRIIQGIRRAFSNESAKAVILEINSPGGSPVQASMIFEEIKTLKAEHPEKRVIAVIDDVGASAAYYIAVAADQIYASRASVVGSIGVRMDSFGFTGLMEKLGIERRLYTAGKFKGILDMFTEPEPEALAQIRATLATIHQQFIDVVKEGRGERLANDPNLFTGMFWSGEEGRKLGLIDGFGDIRYVAETVLGMEASLDYTPPENLLTSLGKLHTAVSSLLSGLVSLVTSAEHPVALRSMLGTDF